MLVLHWRACADRAIDDQFQAWLQTDLWPEAKRAGHLKNDLRRRLRRRQAQLSKLPDLVMPGEKPRRREAASGRVRLARRLFREKTVRRRHRRRPGARDRNAKTLAAIEKRYGVPGQIVLAIWGRETGFGAAKMPYDAFEVLGTKAFMSTRKDFFRTELLAALEIVETRAGSASAR